MKEHPRQGAYVEYACKTKQEVEDLIWGLRDMGDAGDNLARRAAATIQDLRWIVTRLAMDKAREKSVARHYRNECTKLKRTHARWTAKQ